MSQKRLDVFDSQARRQALLQLVRLLQIFHTKSVQVLAATNLEFHDVLGFLNLYSCMATVDVSRLHSSDVK